MSGERFSARKKASGRQLEPSAGDESCHDHANAATKARQRHGHAGATAATKVNDKCEKDQSEKENKRSHEGERKM